MLFLQTVSIERTLIRCDELIAIFLRIVDENKGNYLICAQVFQIFLFCAPHLVHKKEYKQICLFEAAEGLVCLFVWFLCVCVCGGFFLFKS